MNTDTLVDHSIDAPETSDSQTAEFPDNNDITAGASLVPFPTMGHVTHVSPADLKPHPLNSTLYEVSVDKGLLESIRERGIIQPLVATTDMVLVGGHRRWAAAKQLGMESVPVRIAATTSPESVELLLLESNLQRHKTNEVKLREYRHYLRLEKALAKSRQGRKAGGESNIVSNSAPSFASGKARHLAAVKVGMKPSNAERGLKVLEAIEAQGQRPDDRFVDEVRRLLNEQSISAAYNRGVDLGWIKTSGHNVKPSMETDEAASETPRGEHAPSPAIPQPQDVSGGFSNHHAAPEALDEGSNDPGGVERLGCDVLTEDDSVAASPSTMAFAPEEDDGESTPKVISCSTVEERIASIRKGNSTTMVGWSLSDEDQSLIERFTRLLCAAVNTVFADPPSGRLLDCAKMELVWVSTELGVGRV